MDQKECEGEGQNPEIVETQKLLEAELHHFASQTPAKTNESLPLHNKFKEGEFKLLERYKDIVEFFDSVTCSLRLLGLRKKSATFRNISAQVEVLTQRKFSYGQLAQIKYLLPEAVQIDKVLVHDMKTLCMKPDLKIALLFDVVEGHGEESDFIALHQFFSSRLVDYLMKHPEVCAIPEAMLPDPFNQCKQAAFEDMGNDIAPKQLLERTSREYLESEMLPNPSHLPPSFNRHFSQKPYSEKENTQLLASPIPSLVSPSGNLNDEHLNEARTVQSCDLCCESDVVTNLDIKSKQAKESCISYDKFTSINPLPNQPINPLVSVDVCASASPRFTSDTSTDRLMIETPAQLTPRRAMPSCDIKHNMTANQKLTLSYKPAKRILDFSRLEGDESTSECDGFINEKSNRNLDGPSLLKKVEGSLDCLHIDCKACQSDTMNQQMTIHLSELVSLIHQIFQSINFLPITKEELMHKIILDSLDIIDRREVEEQINILEKLVPDWICRIPASSGDFLYNIKKASDLSYIQAMVSI